MRKVIALGHRAVVQIKHVYVGVSHFIVFRCIMLCRYCVSYKFRVRSNLALSKSTGTIFPTFAHFLFPCHFLVISPYFKLFRCICYGDAISDYNLPEAQRVVNIL